MRRAIIILGLAVLMALVGLAIYVPTLGPRLKRKVISAVAERFDADVQLDKLNITIFPVPSADGEGLVINRKARNAGDQPMIRIRHFHAQAGFTTILDWRSLVDKVDLDGLVIHLAPQQSGGPKLLSKNKDETQLKFVIRKIVAQKAMLVIEGKAGKDPLIFPIENVTMTSVGPGQAMAYTALLDNAKPPGAIDASGHFGPWQRDDPRETPLNGTYTFEHADLSVFQGISGVLSSKGSFKGVLQRLLVDGTTDTPKFALQKMGAAVHLVTNFHSIVDGTNGDTTLDPVDAKFGRSEFICSGGIVHHPGEPGKTVELQAHTKFARMEDILALVVGGAPIVKGNVEFQSKIVIPPGKQEVVKKLNLDGQFHLSSAVFTNQQTSDRLRLLSLRASGITKEDEKRDPQEKGTVASNMYAKFLLKNGLVTVAPVAFEVPGSRIQLSGDFNMVSKALDMKGTFQMKAKLSQTQSGFKSLLLKPLDRHFEKDGAGFEVPISITGTQDHPTIGVSIFRKTFSIH